jgi:hypothetical protein
MILGAGLIYPDTRQALPTTSSVVVLVSSTPSAALAPDNPLNHFSSYRGSLSLQGSGSGFVSKEVCDPSHRNQELLLKSHRPFTIWVF